MADERYCRFATKLTCGGVTLIDGILSVSAIDIMVNRVFMDNGLPMMAFKCLYGAKEGFHLHYDMCINGNLLAFEISAVSGPVMSEPRPTA